MHKKQQKTHNYTCWS